MSKTARLAYAIGEITTLRCHPGAKFVVRTVCALLSRLDDESTVTTTTTILRDKLRDVIRYPYILYTRS